MGWMAARTALIAAGVAVPLLVLLYFLKLKRKEMEVSSTFLWKRAVQDLRVNAPLQRIRKSILLLLQLLALAAILVALGRPVLSMNAGQAKRYVILIDRSCSMSTMEDGETRLDIAKLQSRVLVESLRSQTQWLRDYSDEAMIVAFDNGAKVLCNFTSDKARLLAAIDSIEQSDGKSALSEAIVVATAFSGATSNTTAAQTGRPPAKLELFSDGRISDLDEIALAEGELIFHRIGNRNDNVAVVSMQARRSYEKASEVSVFAELANYGDKSVTCDVQLSVDGKAKAVRQLTLKPRTGKRGKNSQAGSMSVTFTLSHEGQGIIEVRAVCDDALKADNAAWAVLQPAKKMRVLLVTTGNIALELALKACPVKLLDVKTPAEFDAMSGDSGQVETSYDVVVIDGYVPASLPRCKYIVFGAAPPGIGVTMGDELKSQAIVDWRNRHPVLQAVGMANVFAAKCRKMDLPRDAEILAEFNDTPAMAVVRRSGSVFVIASFNPMDTNWPFEPGFVMFCYNSLSYLLQDSGAGDRVNLEVLQAFSIEGLPDGSKVKISRPDGAFDEIRSDGGAVRYANTSRVGIYRAGIDDRPEEAFAVNLLDRDESDISPADKMLLSGREVTLQESPVVASNVELWPWFVMVVLAVVCVEWLVYNAKIRI